MARQGFRRRGLVAVVLVFVLSISLMYVTARRPATSAPERWLQDSLAPVQYALVSVSRWVSSYWEDFRNLGRLQQENLQLREEQAVLKARMIMLQSQAAEANRLRRMLGWEQQYPGMLVPAVVIGRDPSTWFNYVTINRGSRDGVRRGLPVISSQGVVGQVRQVTPHTATVLLILDSRSAVGGQLSATGDYVLVTGGAPPDGGLMVRPLAPSAHLAAGQEVVTSGLSAIFPAGLPIGRIRRVERDSLGLGTVGYLQPATDFDRISDVFVLASGTRGIPIQPGPGVQAGAQPTMLGPVAVPELGGNPLQPPALPDLRGGARP